MITQEIFIEWFRYFLVCAGLSSVVCVFLYKFKVIEWRKTTAFFYFIAVSLVVAGIILAAMHPYRDESRKITNANILQKILDGKEITQEEWARFYTAPQSRFYYESDVKEAARRINVDPEMAVDRVYHNTTWIMRPVRTSSTNVASSLTR